MEKIFRVALIGNPNCGKTTVFNLLTGTHQHVGNYPGVTVERKRGVCRIGDCKIQLLDLPGVYALSSSSAEEKITSNELLNNPPDLLLNVIDSAHPQRNFYLTLQLLELGVPMILVLNMADDALRHGLSFRRTKLEELLKTPPVRMVASKGRGIELLRQEIVHCLSRKDEVRPQGPRYSDELERKISRLVEKIAELDRPVLGSVPARYLAIALLEQDEVLRDLKNLDELRLEAEKLCHEFSQEDATDQAFMARERYLFIGDLCKKAVQLRVNPRQRRSETIDRVLLHPLFGLPIFFLTMFAIFSLTFCWSRPITAAIGEFFSAAVQFVHSVWPSGSYVFLRKLLCEGVIGGVGSVLLFLPNIFFLFLGIEFLEGTGYMSRAAFLMDEIMARFRLPGRSFIPMILGFGCSVPAILATRTINSRRDRLTTILIIPLISCGARLPIYALIIPAFFAPAIQSTVMFAAYFFSILLALFFAKFLKQTVFRGPSGFYISELSPYRLPVVRASLARVGNNCWMYIRKAGTLIFGASIVLFLLTSFPEKKQFDRDYVREAEAVRLSRLAQLEQVRRLEQLDRDKKSEMLNYSLAGRLGQKLEHVFSPIGFDAPICSALVGALVAKELFVTQLGILSAVAYGDEQISSLQDHLRENYSPLQGLCILLFCLASTPCFATIAVVKKETGSWRWVILQWVCLLLLSYSLTFVVFQLGRLLI